MCAQTRLLVVGDPKDALCDARVIAALHHPVGGVVVCHSTPVSGLGGLSRDLLRALGKRFDVPESVQDPSALWETAGDWLAGELIAHTIVLRAHLLSVPSAERVWQLARRVGPGTIWLVTSGPEEGEAVAALRRRRRARRATLRQLIGEAAPHANAGTSAPAASEAFPLVPRAEFVLFKRACRELLDDHQLKQVGDAVAHGHATIANHRLTRRPTWPPEAQALLERLLVTAGSADEALARLRGAQIALFAKGLLVTFDADRIPALHAQHYHSPIDAANARRLGIYTSTRLACAGSLTLATRQPARVLARLTVGDIGPYAGALGPHEEPRVLPAYARGPLRAHLHHRARHGATDSDPLFTTRRDPTAPIGLREMHSLIRKVARRSHLTLHCDASPHAQIGRPLDGQLQLHTLT